MAGKSVNRYGLDNTQKIVYTFDRYGFREGNNYQLRPKYVFFGASLLAGIGVEKEQRFSTYFDSSWNFGLCGTYTEEQHIQNYFSFLDSYKDSNNCKIIFCWKCSAPQDLQTLFDKLPCNKNIFHCVPIKIKRERTCLYLKNLDYDVSGTHWGPVTHKKFSKLLWQLLKK